MLSAASASTATTGVSLDREIRGVQTETRLKGAAERRGFRRGVRRPRSWRRLPDEANRHCPADAFEAGEHNSALAPTGRGPSELDLKRPEQSLELRQSEVRRSLQVMIFVIRFLLFVARPRRSGPFLRPGV